MLVGPAVFPLLAGVVVMFDPLLVLGEGEGNRSTARTGASSGALLDDREDGKDEEATVFHAHAPQDPRGAAHHGRPR